MQRGLSFKLMTPKDLTNVLGVIGVHPAATHESIAKPNAECASSMYKQLAEFAYDPDAIAHIKGRAPEVQGIGPYIEIFDEGMGVIAIFKLVEQLALINGIDDFSLKDVWDPQAKRFRAILSGIVNFCRYKESQTAAITTMKQDMQTLENVRLERVEESNSVGHELAEAHAQHCAENALMLVAENQLQESTDVVDELQKQKEVADGLHETAHARYEATNKRLTDAKERSQQLRDNVAALQEQVADSPEDLEQELQELQLAIRQQKARVEERTDEKRAQMQRVQVLGRINGHLDQYKAVLDNVGQSAALVGVACDRSRGARNELAAIRSSLDIRCTEELDLVQAVEQSSVDINDAKQAHDKQVQEFEDRRQQATRQQQELLGERTEEQRQWSELQAQRSVLETEIANVRRSHEMDLNNLESRLTTVLDDGAQYVDSVDGLMTQYGADTGRNIPVLGCRSPSMRSPGSDRFGSARSFRSPNLKASPAPRRLVMERAGY